MKKILALFLFVTIFFSSKSYSKESEIILNAKNALLYDWTYNEILYEKNINEKIPNASTTKILTAIVAYENSNMEELVKISENVPRISGSKIGLRTGDCVKMDDLMKGLLISSGNDAAIAIAEHVGGSVEEFCKMMNKRAAELGAKNTNFVTPHGLDDENHYSTVSDLLIFSKCFMKNTYLKEIANTERTIIRIGELEKELRATNEMLFIYDGVNGVKTGYTNNAGRCLITSIESGDRNLISMVFGCESKSHRTEDTRKLVLYGYDYFEEFDICQNLKKTHEMRVKKAVIPRIELVIKGEKKILLKKGLKDHIRYKYDIPEVLTAPIISGTVIGNIKVYIKDELLREIPIKIPHELKKKDIFQFFVGIFEEQNYYLEIKV